MFVLGMSGVSWEGGRPRPPHGRFLFVLAAMLMLALQPFPARAQGNGPMPVTSGAASASAACTAAAPAPGQPVSAAAITLHQAWQFGGWIMWVIAFLAAAGAASVFRLLGALREQRVVPRGLLLEVLDRIRAGELNEARRLCEDRPGPLSAIAVNTFDHLRHAPRAGGALLRETVGAEAARQADALQSQVGILRDIAVLVPMLGLLGTVLGLLRVFGPAADDAAEMRAIVQAGGVMQALVTSAFALLVAIPVVACHAGLRRRASRRVAALQSAAAEIALAVAGKFDR